MKILSWIALGIAIGFIGTSLYHDKFVLPTIAYNNYEWMGESLVEKLEATHCVDPILTECLAEFPNDLMLTKYCYMNNCPSVEQSLVACPVCEEGPTEDDYFNLQSDLNLCRSQLNNFLY